MTADIIRETNKYRVCTDKLDAVHNPRHGLIGGTIGLLSVISGLILFWWATTAPVPANTFAVLAIGETIAILSFFFGVWYYDTGKVCGIRVYGEYRYSIDKNLWIDVGMLTVPFISTTEVNAAKILAAVNYVERRCTKTVANVETSAKRERERSERCCIQYREVLKQVKRE